MKFSHSLKAMKNGAVMLIIAALVSGCNIFDFAGNEPPPTTRAEEAIREGNYDQARSVLAESVRDSTDSYALYLDAKATLNKAGVDIMKITEIIEGQDAESNDQLALLSIVDELTPEEQTAWYQANMKIAANLGKIFGGTTTGPFEPDDVALEYTVSNMLAGVLGIRDTNQDGVIDGNDFTLNLSFVNLEAADTEGFSFSGGMFEDESGNMSEFNGLEVFLGGLSAAKSVAGNIEGYEPEDINRILRFVLHHLENGSQSLIALLNKAGTTFETDEIEQYLDQIAVVINFYWYNDGIDNDGDGYIDEELIDGQDNDGDGLIDEDSDYTDPAVVFAPGYNPFYDYRIKENNTTNESQVYRQIWEKWYGKKTKHN